jgi:hypothetical protein
MPRACFKGFEIIVIDNLMNRKSLEKVEILTEKNSKLYEVDFIDKNK